MFICASGGAIGVAYRLKTHEGIAMAPSSESSQPTRPSTRLERLIQASPHLAWIVGAAFWVGGILALILHAVGVALCDATTFAILDTWLIGLGCLGCPILAIRTLRRRLTPYVYMLIGAVAAACALLLTILTEIGEMHPDTLDVTFALMLLLAGGIHAVNAADTELHGARAHDEGYQAGRIDALTETLDQRYAALAGIEWIEDLSLGELEQLADVVDKRITVLHNGSHAPLKLISQTARDAVREPREPGAHHGKYAHRPAPDNSDAHGA